MLNERLIARTRAKANEQAIIKRDALRITVLTPRTIRVEKDNFTDSATQAVWYRDLPLVDFSVAENGDELTIKTESGAFIINKDSGDLIRCERDGKEIPYRPEDNRLGTVRTLDRANGAVKLEKGLISRSGVSEMRDDTLLLGEDGMVTERGESNDRYYFNASSPRETLFDYYTLTGFPPLPPRYALGNWWSRYWKYTDKEYLTLLKRFKEEDVPFWMATLDMDWHWVGVFFKFGYCWGKDKPYSFNVSTFQPGWTGFSWNTDFFPDPEGFLKQVHDMGYTIPVNLHPADGVRWYETQYKAMCEAMKVDPKKKKAVPFDVSSSDFLNAYFDVLLRPLEDEGVDVWWIDWQQGKKSKIPGLDPLWACNHYHTLDSARNGKRPLILSRYAGIGSHRYPLGFSGDTHVTWKSLDFQPYFTANSTNAGYPAWSHDIGGHMQGRQSDDELYLRWLQFGVFSPVMRLHSNCRAISKEPWNHKPVENIAKNFLRLRHKLVPYIYSAMADTAKNGIALIEPLYYRTDEAEAENYPNEYFFGPNLLVAPITSHSDKGVSKMKIWLPKGVWTDLFTDEQLEGGAHEITRSLDSIPVYIKEGGIIPMQDDVNDRNNPSALTVYAAAGNGSYTLYEDENDTQSYLDNVCHTTLLTSEVKDETYILTKHPGEGAAVVPEKRTWSLKLPAGFRGEVRAAINGNFVKLSSSDGIVTVKDVADSATLVFTALKG